MVDAGGGWGCGVGSCSGFTTSLLFVAVVWPVDSSIASTPLTSNLSPTA
jgi:hypothetical protein